MTKRQTVLCVAFATLLLAVLAVVPIKKFVPSAFVKCEVDLSRTEVKLYWKDEQNQRFKSLQRLKDWLNAKQQKLLFAMNAGMFNAQYAPQGLFIQERKTVAPLDTATGTGNFYLKPNGVFYLTTANTAHICRTEDFTDNGRVTYATQSGPLLLINGSIHPAFRPGSANRHIRNGVGILPNNRVLFAMSKTKISLYDFAQYFKRAGCRNALYLDGFVSRAYAPAEHWTQTDGDFGVIIGVTEPQQRPR